MPLRLYNTLTRQLEPLRPLDPAHVTFYTCGPTVYDDAHIGNFRSFLGADLLRRWIESPLCELKTRDGRLHNDLRKVTHVINITDVGHMTDDAEGGESGEDRMAVAGRRIEEAKKSGKLPAGVNIDPRDPYQIARFYESRFKEDAKKLGLKVALDADKDPSLMPRATENIEGMKTVIQRLIDKGFAYVIGAPGSRVVYFDVQKFPTYGRLSGNTLDQLRAGAGGRVAAENQAQKRHPADFLLWKEDASHVMKWPSPWGTGYPGWHIECTAMSIRRLLNGNPDLLNTLELPNGRPAIDLHSGGEDNIFPHHECEIAQSCGAFNAEPTAGTFSSLWFHPRFLLVEGTKMSKSKGNFYTARDLFAKGIEPAAVRLELIKTHYASNADFTFQGLEDSVRRINRWRRFAKLITHHATAKVDIDANVVGDLLQKFSEALNNNLNISVAVSVVDELLRRESPAGVIARIDQLDPEFAKNNSVQLAKIDAMPIPSEPLDAAEALALIERGNREGTLHDVLGMLHLVDGVLGVIFAPNSNTTSDVGIFVGGLAPDLAVIEKLEERRAARAAKNFKRSDEIRDELAAMGYAIKDVAGGKVEVRKA